MYFLDYCFKFQPNISTRCHDLLMMFIKDSDYGCIISLMSENKKINLLQNAEFTFKKWKIINYKWNWYWNPKTKISPT